jgi:hypothetical protein
MPTKIEVYPVAQTDAEIVALKTAASEAAAAADAAEAETARVQAAFDAYREKYPPTTEPPIPPQPVTKTLVGSSLQSSAGDFEAYATRCGGLESIRSFSTPGEMPTSLSSSGKSVASSVGKRHIAHSFKGRFIPINDSLKSLADGKDDSWINSWLDSKPATQRLSWIFRHEPDEESPDPALWKKAQIKARALTDAANARGRAKYGAAWVDIQFGANFMSWSVQKVPARIANLYPGKKVWDFISWDGYAQSPEAGAVTFAKCKEWNDTVGGGEPFAIGETGLKDMAASGTVGEQFIKSVMDYAKSVNAPWAHYWNASLGGDKNYVLNASQEKVLGAQS